MIVDLFRNVKQCLAQKCKDVRAAYVNSSNAELFSCEHTALCDKAVPPIKVYSLTDGLINSYPVIKPQRCPLSLETVKHWPCCFSGFFSVILCGWCGNSIKFCWILPPQKHKFQVCAYLFRVCSLRKQDKSSQA